ncbi:MAG TPA: hypothetical protein VEZ91_10815 [Kurthia gibsonii]|nr:hypothetical protein [Kurthia gibsonii]
MNTTNLNIGNSSGIEVIELDRVEDKLGTADFNMAKEKFSLAKNILLFLFVLTIVIIMIRIEPENKDSDGIKELFNTVFQSIVPMSSLVIGYYFGSKESKE